MRVSCGICGTCGFGLSMKRNACARVSLITISFLFNLSALSGFESASNPVGLAKRVQELRGGRSTAAELLSGRFQKSTRADTSKHVWSARNTETKREAASSEASHNIFEAAAICNLTGVEEALRHGVPVDLQSPHDGWTSLHWACFNGDVAMCNLLLDRGANFNHQDKSGCNPLDKAVLRGRKGAVQLLLAHGAKISSAASKYLTRRVPFLGFLVGILRP